MIRGHSSSTRTIFSHLFTLVISAQENANEKMKSLLLTSLKCLNYSHRKGSSSNDFSYRLCLHPKPPPIHLSASEKIISFPIKSQRDGNSWLALQVILMPICSRTLLSLPLPILFVIEVFHGLTKSNHNDLLVSSTQ